MSSGLRAPPYVIAYGATRPVDRLRLRQPRTWEVRERRTLPGAFSPADGLESPPAERFDPSSAVLHQSCDPHRAIASRCP
jgi:hypothetical protein